MKLNPSGALLGATCTHASSLERFGPRSWEIPTLDLWPRWPWLDFCTVLTNVCSQGFNMNTPIKFHPHRTEDLEKQTFYLWPKWPWPVGISTLTPTNLTFAQSRLMSAIMGSTWIHLLSFIPIDQGPLKNRHLTFDPNDRRFQCLTFDPWLTIAQFWSMSAPNGSTWIQILSFIPIRPRI